MCGCVGSALAIGLLALSVAFARCARYVRAAFSLHSCCVRPVFALRLRLQIVRAAFALTLRSRLRCVRAYAAFALRLRSVRAAFLLRSRCVRTAFLLRSRCFRATFA